MIFTGHTHQAYVYERARRRAGRWPVHGPVLQTGNYADHVGKVDAHGRRRRHRRRHASHRRQPAAGRGRRTCTLPARRQGEDDRRRRQGVRRHDRPAADRHADGATSPPPTPAAATPAPAAPTWPASGGPNSKVGRDDRASESTLGDLVANALRDTLAPANLGGAQIGVVNPGGLRDELFYNQTGVEGDGVITYAEANNVLPFVNNLWTTTLTGAQFKTMLEQQWQRDASGSVPTRPYLQLGLSDNVTYTFDDTLPEGSRITSITINGAPYDPAATLPHRHVLVPHHRWRQLPDLHPGHERQGLRSRRS